MYNYLQGFASDGSSRKDPEGNITKFLLSGDPISKSGWCDKGPRERYFVMTAGPFDFPAQDTVVIVGAKIIAQGLTNLLSVHELRKANQIVQNFYDHNLSPLLASFNTEAYYDVTDHARISISTMLKKTATNVIAYINDLSLNPLSQIELYDDGNHNDGNAFDGTFANEIVLESHATPYYIDMICESQSETYNFYKMGHITTIGPVDISAVNVVNDNINNDYKINPGEVIAGTATLQNQTKFSFPEIIAVTSFSDGVDFIEEPLLTFSEVQAEAAVVGNYNPNDPNSYLIFQASQNAQAGDTVWAYITLMDTVGNYWEQQFPLLIHAFETTPTDLISIEHVSGTGNGNFYYRVVDTHLLTDNTYEIHIIEPQDSSENYWFTLKDLDLSSNILSDHPLPDKYSFNIPITDGFKLYGDEFGIATPITFKSAIQTVDADPTDEGLSEIYDLHQYLYLDNGLYATLGLNLRKPSSELLQYDLELRFTGITDTGDWYGVVTTGGSMGTQWEKAAIAESDLSGYVHVPVRLPFELWDIENNRQINCAVFNRNRDGECPYEDGVGDPGTSGVEPRWRISGMDYIIPIITDYNPNSFHSPNDSCATWCLFFSRYASWTTGDIVTLVYTNVLTNSDVFSFKPMYIDIDNDVATTKKYQLLQNYPNPFNSSTTIRYNLSKDSHVFLCVYNSLGQLIKTVVDQRQQADNYSIRWDGTNQAGKDVASGLYFYRLKIENSVQTKKMIVMR